MLPSSAKAVWCAHATKNRGRRDNKWCTDLSLTYQRIKPHRQTGNGQLAQQQPTTDMFCETTHRVLILLHPVLAAAVVIIIVVPHKAQPTVDVAAKEVHRARWRTCLLPRSCAGAHSFNVSGKKEVHNTRSRFRSSQLEKHAKWKLPDEPGSPLRPAVADLLLPRYATLSSKAALAAPSAVSMGTGRAR